MADRIRRRPERYNISSDLRERIASGGYRQRREKPSCVQPPIRDVTGVPSMMGRDDGQPAALHLHPSRAQLQDEKRRGDAY
jgi:hypothetical protein